MLPGTQVNCAVLVTNVKEVLTKAKGERMAFVTVEDLTGHAEITFFPRDYAAARGLLNGEAPLLLNARVETDQNGDSGQEDEENPKTAIKMLGSGVRLLEDVCKDSLRPVIIRIPPTRLNRNDLFTLKNILCQNRGMVAVEAIVELNDLECYIKLGEDTHVCPGPKLEMALREWAS